MSELKPCPFCGGDAETISGGPGNVFVQCTGCKASSDDKVRTSAIDAWNRRSPAPTVGDDLVERLRSGEASNPAHEVVWVQNLRAHLTDGMFSRAAFPEWNDIFLREFNALLAASSEAAAAITTLRERVATLTEALQTALPMLQENARWHRDAQSHAGVTARAFDALNAVERALARARTAIGE